MPKRNAFQSLLSLLLLTFWSPSTNAAGANAQQVEFIYIERPPYTYKANDNLQGILVEITRASLSSATFSYRESVVTNWLDILNMLKIEKTMCTVGAYKTKERMKVYKYSDALLEESNYMVIANKRVAEALGHTVSLKDLYTSGFIFGYQKGFSYGDTIDNFFVFSDIKKVELSFILLEQGEHKERHIFTLVDRGQIDYFFMNKLEFYWNNRLQKSNKNNLVPLTLSPNVATNARHLMCHKAFPDAKLNEFNRRLAQFKQSPDYRDLLKKYHWPIVVTHRIRATQAYSSNEYSDESNSTVGL